MLPLLFQKRRATHSGGMQTDGLQLIKLQIALKFKTTKVHQVSERPRTAGMQSGN